MEEAGVVMATLFNENDRTRILERIDALMPTKTPLWGRFTAPEMVCHERFSQRGPNAAWPPSKVFGRISGSSWGVLQHKHLDHHLRQFGV
jgi:hypothetical protein